MKARDALKEILTLSEEDRRWLVEEIAASLSEKEADFVLTPELKAKLDRRIAEHEANPDSAIPWEEVQSRVRALLGK